MSASGTKYCKRDANPDTGTTGKALFNPGTVRVEMEQTKVRKERNGT